MTDASLAPQSLENSGQVPPVPWPLVEACGLPEVGAQIGEISVRLDPNLSRPFTFDARTVRVRPDRAATVTGSALILREAIELDACGGDPGWADRILAHATALVFGVTGLAHRGERPALNTFSPLVDMAAELLALHDDEPGDGDAARKLAERIARHLEIRDESGSAAPDDEIERAARALPYAAPAEVIMTSGGDDRQVVDWMTGLNSYGIAPSPTPWTASFGSCTASSPTVRAFGAATRLRRRLIQAAMDGGLDSTVADHNEQSRRTLLAALGVDEPNQTDVVFTPSGTDAEYVPLVLALSTGRPVHSVVVGQYEIGSGSTCAAGGKYFGSSVPAGYSRTDGETLPGIPSAQVTCSTVDIRESDGEMRPADDVEHEIAQSIREYGAKCQVLVHVVEGSKTGIRLPRTEAVAAWKREFGDGVDVVVDAAQMRIDQHTAVAHLRAGSAVIVTGSKFFGGPPFSGAVLLPSSLAGRMACGTDAPTGIGDYLTQADVPETMPDLRAAARPGLNAGLLLRWEAALAEMRSFHNVSPEIRDEVLRLLVAGLRKLIEETVHVTLIESPFTRIPRPDYRGLDDLPTIFTFLIHTPDGRALSMDGAKAVYRLLSRDLQDIVPEGNAVLGRTFQLGQPVRIYQRDGEWVGALRIAIGAPMISEIVFDHRRGRRWTHRIDRVLADASDALRKLELVLRHVEPAELPSFG